MTENLLKTPVNASQFGIERPIAITPENLKKILGDHVISNPGELPLFRGNVEGLVVLVTGASRGIGADTARYMGEMGMKVVVNSRPGSAESGKSVVSDIKQNGGEAVYVGADVTRDREAKTAVDSAYDAFGKLDVVVHNAGTTKDHLMLQMTEDEWTMVMDTNAKSAFLISKYASQRMARQRSGHHIYVSSIGEAGLPGQVNYAASKAAMERVADVTAREFFEKRGISTTVARLGLVDTDLTSDLTPDQRKSLINIMPAHRSFHSREIAHGLTSLVQLRGTNRQVTFA